jgi:hypothetical protein
MLGLRRQSWWIWARLLEPSNDGVTMRVERRARCGRWGGGSEEPWVVSSWVLRRPTVRSTFQRLNPKERVKEDVRGYTNSYQRGAIL